MTVQVMPGPDVGRTHALGLAGPAFEAEIYRLQPEGLSLRPVSEGNASLAALPPDARARLEGEIR
jgi:hypothetical protein